MESEVPFDDAYDAPPHEDFSSAMEDPPDSKSDFKSTTPADGYPNADGHYWFGKMFYKCIMAEIVFRSAQVPLQGKDIDAALNTALSQFQYGQCLARLSDLKTSAVGIDGSQRTSSTYEAPMIKIGATIHTGSTNAKAQVATAIWKCAAKANPVVDHWQQNLPHEPLTPPRSPRSTESAETQLRAPPAQATRGGAPDSPAVIPGLYLSRLLEHAREHGVLVQEQPATRVGDHLFEQTIMVNRTPFKGTKKSKKEARHDASRKACEHLGIRY